MEKLDGTVRIFLFAQPGIKQAYMRWSYLYHFHLSEFIPHNPILFFSFFFRDLKELYLQFNARNGGNPSQAQIELEELIETYRKSRHEIFREFASLLEKYKSSIINSFIMVEKIGNGRIYDSRLSNGSIESINRKIKDLKRLGRGFRNFEHFRNRFLYATRSVPVLNGITDYNPVLYLEEDDF